MAKTTFLILLHFITTYSTSCLATRPILPTTSNIEYITKSCNTTMYPKLCYKSLAIYAQKIQSNPTILVSIALSVTLSAAKSIESTIKNISVSKKLKHTETIVITDCVEELSDSVYELHDSIKEMAKIGGLGFEIRINNVQTWVSAALTNGDTCMDGFEGSEIEGEIRTIVQKHVLRVAHLTSVALALVNNYAKG